MITTALYAQREECFELLTLLVSIVCSDFFFKQGRRSSAKIWCTLAQLMQFRQITESCAMIFFTHYSSPINRRGNFSSSAALLFILLTDSLGCFCSMRMWSWLFICTILGITSMHDVSAQTCLCAQGLCANGWVQYKSACYKAVRQRYSWTEAEIFCQTFSPTSHLASIHSVEENDFIFHMMGKPIDYNKGEAYWIGAHDTFKEGTFVWTDGSRFDFNSFPAEQPDGLGGEHYLGSWFIRNEKISWNDYSNSWKLLSVCKYYLANRGCSSC